MADNGEKRFQKVLEGIQYLIGDNKHLREDLAEFARQAAEDRKRADERFDRMMRKMDEDRARSDERFAVLLDQVKRTNRVAVDVARGIRKQLQEGQERILGKLDAILKRLPPGPNGK
jgi:hypothetical protein